MVPKPDAHSEGGETNSKRAEIRNGHMKQNKQKKLYKKHIFDVCVKKYVACHTIY